MKIIVTFWMFPHEILFYCLSFWCFTTWSINQSDICIAYVIIDVYDLTYQSMW